MKFMEKKMFLFCTLLIGAVAAMAQPSSGDRFEGLTRKIGFSRMIPPHGLEITYDKTVHVIFPSPVRYVDLGSENLIAGKADGAENVIRVKAVKKNFRGETNMSVITESGRLLQFQREVRRRTAAAQCRDVRLHTRRRGGEPPQQRYGDLPEGT